MGAARPAPGAAAPGGPEQAAVELLVLRHAPTGWNDESRRQGWADLPLTGAARAATQAWARRVREPFCAVVCSDLLRARETAEIIAAALGLAGVEAMATLREQDQGAWTGLTKAQIKRRWPERMRERPRRPVGGEPAEELLTRVLAALHWIARAHAGRRVLIVAHSGVIHALERAAGVEAPPVPHLEGRWFRLPAGAPGAELPAEGSLLAGEPTPERRRLLAARSAGRVRAGSR